MQLKSVLPAKNYKQKNYNQPEMRLLSGVRYRLTLWYTGVLAIALLLFGSSLYIIVSNNLYAPVKDDLSNQIKFLSFGWQNNSSVICPLPGTLQDGDQPGGHGGPPNNRKPLFLYVACYDQNGNLLAAGDDLTQTVSEMPTAFINSNLAQQVLAQGSNGTATDLIDAGTVGPLYRYATIVHLSDGQTRVLVIARSVSDIQSALDLLRNISLLLGVLTLAGAAVGGIFLSNRALAPTRQAFLRQQAFIADASHELRTPLTILRTDAEILLRSSNRLENDDAELVEDIVAESERLSNLANSLLELARLDAGKIQLEQEVTSLSDLAGDTVRRLERIAAEKNVRLMTGRLANVLVTVDIQLMEQCLLILTDNAVKYTPAGGTVTMEATVINEQPVIKVSDTGIGISPEHLPQLGQRFYRVDKARSREAGGAGLGLSLAFSIARMHDGNLEFASEPNRGTTVTLTLPATRLVDSQLVAHS